MGVVFLDVMARSAIGLANRGCSRLAREENEARAAVAELIEAADNVFHNAPNGPYMERLAKALDFMTGEAS